MGPVRVRRQAERLLLTGGLEGPIVVNRTKEVHYAFDNRK